MKILNLLYVIAHASVDQNLTGTLTINNFDYKVLCECGNQEPSLTLEEPASCPIKNINIVVSRHGEGFTPETIRDIIDIPQRQTFQEVEKASFYCMDGRNTEKQLYTPGGDFGEFLLALHVYEGLTNPLQYADVQKLFENYLKSMKPKFFYFCTDDESIRHIEKELNKSFTFQNLVSPFIQDQKTLLRLLQKSENQGDLHLSFMIKYPQYYSIRPELISYLLKTFFSMVWNKDHPNNAFLKVDNLIGKHQEKAFVEIRTSVCPQEAPKLATQNARDQQYSILINHIDAVQIRRQQLSAFFIDSNSNKNADLDKQTMLNRMNRHGLAFLEITGSFVAKEVPFYTITYS